LLLWALLDQFLSGTRTAPSGPGSDPPVSAGMAYGFRRFVAEGGLLSYAPDRAEPYRLAAGYIDRILKGAKPADLSVQAPSSSY
jgi:hypothetical protein